MHRNSFILHICIWTRGTYSVFHSRTYSAFSFSTCRTLATTQIQTLFHLSYKRERLTKHPQPTFPTTTLTKLQKKGSNDQTKETKESITLSKTNSNSKKILKNVQQSSRVSSHRIQITLLSFSCPTNTTVPPS